LDNDQWTLTEVRTAVWPLGRAGFPPICNRGDMHPVAIVILIERIGDDVAQKLHFLTKQDTMLNVW